MGLFYEMTIIYKTAMDMEINSEGICEKILKAVMLTGEMSPEVYEIFWNYSNDKINGELVIYSETGQIIMKGIVKDEKFTGKKFRYDENGQMVFEEEYKDGIDMSAFGENINEEDEEKEPEM